MQRRQGLRGGRRGAAARRGAQGHARSVGGDGELEDGVVRVGVAAALGEEEEGGPGREAVVPGLDVEGDDGALAGEPHGRGGEHEVRGGEVGGSRGGGGEEVLPRDGVEALGAGDEAGDEPLGAGVSGGTRTAADRAAEAGLAGDDPVEEDGDEHPAGEDEASAGDVEAQGGELEVGLLHFALEGGLQDAGLGSGVEAPRERRGLHGAEGLLVGAVAHRDGLGRTGGRGEEVLEKDEVLRRDGADAGAEADDGVGPGAAGGESRVSGLGEIEEAGDEEPLRAVLLREGVEAAGPQLERHARTPCARPRAARRRSGSP